MDLEVAPVDAVVVGDDVLRELDVLVLERLERPVDLRDDDVEPAERRDLRALELLDEVRPGIVRSHPRSARVSRTCR